MGYSFLIEVPALPSGHGGFTDSSIAGPTSISVTAFNLLPCLTDYAGKSSNLPSEY